MLSKIQAQLWLWSLLMVVIGFSLGSFLMGLDRPVCTSAWTNAVMNPTLLFAPKWHDIPHGPMDQLCLEGPGKDKVVQCCFTLLDWPHRTTPEMTSRCIEKGD